MIVGELYFAAIYAVCNGEVTIKLILILNCLIWNSKCFTCLQITLPMIFLLIHITSPTWNKYCLRSSLLIPSEYLSGYWAIKKMTSDFINIIKVYSLKKSDIPCSLHTVIIAFYRVCTWLHLAASAYRKRDNKYFLTSAWKSPVQAGLTCQTQC